MMGDSITEMWRVERPEFFDTYGFINRGISGQVTGEMLQRFQHDVIEEKPDAVVILGGINDIAQNQGYISIPDIASNIRKMAEMAASQEIRVILCSVLPASDFPWRPGLNPSAKVIELNRLILAISEEMQLSYVDYYSEMVDENNGLRVPDFTTADDLVHPNAAGYVVMEGVLIDALNK